MGMKYAWMFGALVVIAISGMFFLNRSQDPNGTLGVQDDNVINIYFPIRPKSVTQFAYTEGVERTVTYDSAAKFAVEQLIDGPSESEKDVGFYSALVLEGESDCGGEDFELDIDNDTKSATLRFCREIIYRNRGDEERVQASLARTLTELEEISSLVYSDTRTSIN